MTLSIKSKITKNNRYITIGVSLILIAVILVSVFATGANASSSKAVKPRWQPACKGDSSYGYYTDKNIFYQYGYGMPNCTCYAYGRAYELLGYEPNLCPYDAGQWYDYNIEHGYYSYGKTPKIGAIACWQYGGNGHVAVVEAIVGDKIIMSQSAWGYLNFYLSVEDYDNPGQSNWDFQGYIYPGEFTSTGFGGDLYRNIYSEGINLRSGAGTEYDVIDTLDYCMGFVVTDKIQNGGYTWGKTSYLGQEGYVALTGSVQYLTSSGTSPDPTQPETEPTTQPPTPDVNQFYVITSDDGVNMRSGPGTSNPKTGFIPYYSNIRISKIAENGGYTWGFTSYNGKEGWCVLNYAKRLYGADNSTEILDFYDSETGIIGDVNGDGKASINDVVVMQMFNAKYLRLTEDAINCADLNKNGNIDINDISTLQMHLAKLLSFIS